MQGVWWPRQRTGSATSHRVLRMQRNGTNRDSPVLEMLRHRVGPRAEAVRVGTVPRGLPSDPRVKKKVLGPGGWQARMEYGASAPQVSGKTDAALPTVLFALA